MPDGPPLSRRQFVGLSPAARLGCSCAWLFLSGCPVEAGKCGKHQEQNEYGKCVCIEGYRLDERLRCVACAENEVSAGDRCECAPGFGRSPPGVCEELPAGLGAACNRDEDCVDQAAPSCFVEGSSGYCTVRGCAGSDDCSGGYACDQMLEPSVCRAPPSGQGAACDDAADCAGFEASYCETASSNVCLVPDCELSGSDCFEGWSCCDLRAFGLPTLCVEEGSCPVP